MKENHQTEDRNWEKLAKSFFDGTPENTAEKQLSVLEEVLSDGKERAQVLKIKKQLDLYFYLKKYQTDRAWQKVESRIHSHSPSMAGQLRQLVANHLFRIAAAVLLAALLIVAGYQMINNPSASGNQLEVAAGDQVLQTFKLPDGSLVSLNNDTRINYPKKFGTKTRELNIEGEAFFEVTPDKNRPFIIKAGKAQIKVLGTSFNISAYPETKLVEVIVETGKVQVINPAAPTFQANKLILNPGDKGTLVYSGNSLQKTVNPDPNYLAWKTHILNFKAIPLVEVIKNIEKVYKVNIHLADQKLNGLLLTAQFNDYPLDFILKVIETTFQIDTQVVNGQYILKSRS